MQTINLFPKSFFQGIFEILAKQLEVCDIALKITNEEIQNRRF
jgi:hypothetical protein